VAASETTHVTADVLKTVNGIFNRDDDMRRIWC